MQLDIVADYQNEVGEGPMWHPRERLLYWVDAVKGLIYRYDPETGDHGLFYDHGGPTAGYTFQEDGGLLLFLSKGGIAMLRDGKLTYLVKELPGEECNRFNDVIADPAGRVFAGTMALDSDRAVAGEVLGSLYLVETDGSITKMLDGIGISNGLGFSPDQRLMYYTDSTARNIYVFDYQAESGEISNQRVLVETTDGDGMPDGMTVDADGYIWSARASGSALYRYTSNGIEERSIDFPAKLVSSVMFGGADLTDIYVTSIGGDDRVQYGPGSGALFRLNLGIKGLPEYYSRIQV